MAIQLEPEDIKALGIICELAGHHPNELHLISHTHGVRPEWIAGLTMKLETLLDGPPPPVVSREETIQALLTAAEAVLDPEPCRYDHHGNCQAHNLGNPCEQAVLREAIANYRAS